MAKTGQERWCYENLARAGNSINTRLASTHTPYLRILSAALNKGNFDVSAPLVRLVLQYSNVMALVTAKGRRE